MHKIINVSDIYFVYGISVMESIVNQSILKGRPYGGVAILIKSDLNKLVKFSKCSERFVCL